MLTGYYGDADIPFLLGEDFGVVVVCAGVTTVGIKDEVGKGYWTDDIRASVTILLALGGADAACRGIDRRRNSRG